MIKFIEIIILMILAEGTCAAYINYISRKKPFYASLWCAVNIMLSRIVIIGCVENNFLILAAMIGAFIGTYVVVKYHKD